MKSVYCYFFNDKRTVQDLSYFCLIACRRSFFLIILAIIILFFALPVCGASAPNSAKKVLLVHAVGSQYPVVQLFNQGFMKEITTQYPDDQVDIFNEYLDLNFYTPDKQTANNLALFLKEKYAKNQPDIVVTNLAPAASFMLQYGREIFPEAIIILSGNPQGEESIKSYAQEADEVPPNYAWVHSGDVDIQKEAELILQLTPSTKKIYVVIGDSEEERMNLLVIQKEFAELNRAVEFVYLNKQSFSGMLNEITKIKIDSVVYFYSYFNDIEGKPYISERVAGRIHAIAPVPMYVSNDTYMGRGAIGGYMESYELLGQKTAEVIRKLTNGKNLSDISPKPVTNGQYIFDWRELKRFGIDESRLPSNSKILYREYNVWELYYKYIIAGVTIIIMEGFLIALLVLSNSAKRRAEDSLRLLNTQLEQKVVERTQQLEESNATLEKEIYERTMAQQELIASNDELEAVNYQIKLANDELERMSLTDKLTGAWNRRHFEKEAAIEIERCERYKEVCSLIVMDIDHFKKVNDQYGHLVGDAVLSELAKLLQNNLRKVDSLTRWGGEEFMVLAKHTGGSSAMVMAEKLRHLVATHDFPEVGEVTVSMGVAEFKSGKTLDNWIKVADDALYEAKRLGRNRIQFGNHCTGQGFPMVNP